MKTITLFEIKNGDGEVIGSFVKTISAREEWEMRIMRKQFHDSIKNCPTLYWTPVFEDEKDK